jgi:hypothetical protein
MFDADWITAQNQMEYPYALAKALSYSDIGFRGDAAVIQYAAADS